MSKEKKLKLPGDYYPFEFLEGTDITYVFQTDTGVRYEVKFKHSAYIFPSQPALAKYIYEFTLLMGYKPPGNPKIASDKLIPSTVIAIFIDFYERFDNNNITIYICDSSDLKQFVRKRKFDQWFKEFNQGAFVKIDIEITDLDGTVYPVAIIMNHNNLYRTQVFEAFVKLADSYNNEK